MGEVAARPTSFDALAIRRRLGRGLWGPPIPFGPDGWMFDHVRKQGRIIVTCALADGLDWVHASVSARERMPSYAELKHLHRAVFGDGWAYQVFAPQSEHVNIHEFALHLFGRLDGLPALPDFTYGMRSI